MTVIETGRDPGERKSVVMEQPVWSWLLRSATVSAWFEVCMWARTNGMASHARSTTPVILGCALAGFVAFTLVSLAIVFGAVLLGDYATRYAPLLIVAMETAMTMTTLMVATPRARERAYQSPYTRLIVDGLGASKRAMAVVRGAALPALKIVSIGALTTLTALATGQDLAVVSAAGLLTVFLAVFAVSVTTVPPKTSRRRTFGLAVGSVAGVVVGLLIRELNTASLEGAALLLLVNDLSQGARLLAGTAPFAVIVGFVVLYLWHRRGGATTTDVRKLSPVHGWVRAFWELPLRDWGRGPLLLRNVEYPLQCIALAVCAAGITSFGSTGEVTAALDRFWMLPVVAVVIVMTAIAIFMNPEHILPFLSVVIRTGSGGVVGIVGRYLGVLAVRIWLTSLLLGLGTSLLSQNVVPLFVATVAAMGAAGGLAVGPLTDPYRQRMPDGTVEISVFGHAVMGLFPISVALLAALGGPFGLGGSVLLAVGCLLGGAITILRRIKPL